MKYFYRNLSKQVQDLYVENYKMLMKETQDLNKWRGIYYVEMSVFPKLFIDSLQSQSKSQHDFR